MSDIEMHRKDHVATVVLNRPDKHNAIDSAMWTELGRLFDELAKDSSVRCVVVAGAGGRAFSSGADIAEFETIRATAEQAEAYGAMVHDAWSKVSSCPHPVVAAIDGLCVGGGLELACMADLRIASDDSRFGVPVKRLGLVLAYAELQPVLTVLGPARTLELLLDGRIIDSTEAQRIGLVGRVASKASFADAVDALADSIAAGAPLSARWHKQFVRRLLDPRPITPDEARECYRCFDTEDFRIGREAFLAKTAPDFIGR